LAKLSKKLANSFTTLFLGSVGGASLILSNQEWSIGSPASEEKEPDFVVLWLESLSLVYKSKSQHSNFGKNTLNEVTLKKNLTWNAGFLISGIWSCGIFEKSVSSSSGRRI
jgi:hypothetical protein